MTLSQREKEIIQCVVDGKMPEEIADTLNISRKTVAVHKHNLRLKTGAKSDVDLYKWAQENKQALKV